MTTLLVADDLFLEHITPTGHPERPDRLRAIARALSDERFAGLKRIGPKPVDDAVLATAHDPRYVAAVRAAIPGEGHRPARRRHLGLAAELRGRG